MTLINFQNVDLTWVGIAVAAIGILGFIVFKLIDLVIGLRVSPATEVEGLDLPEMGVPGYVGVSDHLGSPEFAGGSPLSAGKPVPASGD